MNQNSVLLQSALNYQPAQVQSNEPIIREEAPFVFHDSSAVCPDLPHRVYDKEQSAFKFIA